MVELILRTVGEVADWRRFEAVYGYAGKLRNHGNHCISCAGLCGGNSDNRRKIVIEGERMVQWSDNHGFERGIEGIILYYDEPFYRTSRRKADTTLEDQGISPRRATTFLYCFCEVGQTFTKFWALSMAEPPVKLLLLLFLDGPKKKLSCELGLLPIGLRSKKTEHPSCFSGYVQIQPFH